MRWRNYSTKKNCPPGQRRIFIEEINLRIVCATPAACALFKAVKIPHIDSCSFLVLFQVKIAYIKYVKIFFCFFSALFLILMPSKNKQTNIFYIWWKEKEKKKAGVIRKNVKNHAEGVWTIFSLLEVNFITCSTKNWI